MREIKFRVWDGEAMDYNPRAWCEDINECLAYPNDENAFVMQYTGLKDKNGKEIYEGDIISITEVDEDSCFGSENTDVVEVKWINEIAQWRAVFQSGRRTELHLSVSLPTVIDCTVIGNIYEHSNLIKTQND